MRLSFFLLLALLLTACPKPTPALKNAGDVPQEESSAYATVGPSDLLQIRVIGEQALSGEYRVSPKGTISFPWLGDIAVNGLLAGEVQDKLIAGLREGYLRDPQVIVDIKEANSQKIYIFGQIKNPGTFRYKDHMSAIEAIALAGGLTVEADGNNVTLTRVREGVEVTYTIRVNDIAVGKARNVELLPGDILNVPLRKW